MCAHETASAEYTQPGERCLITTGDALADFNKFELRAPSAQNLIDIFSGKWASDFGKIYPGLNAGIAELFVSDERPRLAAQYLGTNGRLDAMSVLELGPLEAGHTYQLEQLGADITAVEANCEAYLKCLLVKELLNLKELHQLVASVPVSPFFQFIDTGQEVESVGWRQVVPKLRLLAKN